MGHVPGGLIMQREEWTMLPRGAIEHACNKSHLADAGSSLLSLATDLAHCASRDSRPAWKPDLSDRAHLLQRRMPEIAVVRKYMIVLMLI
jgi:hypothetical protein